MPWSSQTSDSIAFFDPGLGVRRQIQFEIRMPMRFRNDLRTLSALTMVKNNQYAAALANFILLSALLGNSTSLGTALSQGLAALDMALCIALYCLLLSVLMYAPCTMPPQEVLGFQVLGVWVCTDPLPLVGLWGLPDNLILANGNCMH